MIDPHSLYLLIIAAVAVVGLILLIVFAKLNPFIALLGASLGLALAAGMAPQAIIHSFEAGLGNTLGHIAVVIALGTMLGKMMAESGGADQIAFTLIRLFGEKRVHWAMVVIGLIIGLPAFFEVGFVLLIPVAYTVARRTRTSLVLVGLPLVAGLSVVHGLVPPHPAAMLAVTLFHADVGRTIFYALLIGIPTAIIAGPVWAKIIAPHIQLPDENPMADQFLDHASAAEGRELPGFALTLATILLPVVLMLAGSLATAITRKGSTANEVLGFIGNDDIALLIGAVFSFYSLGRLRGITRATILRYTNECLGPTALITLLVGAGGGFGRILEDSGVAHAVIQLALNSHIPLLLLAWLLAALMRLATGSSTVAMSTAAGIVAPIALHNPNVNPSLLAIATGAGSLIFSHVNDGGFWLVKEYFNMSVADTLKIWSICETLISVVALGLTAAVSLVH